MKGVGFGLGEGRFCKGWRLEVGEGGRGGRGRGDGVWGWDRRGLKRYVDDGRDYIGISIKPPPHLFQSPNPHHLLEPLPPNSIASTKPQ